MSDVVLLSSDDVSDLATVTAFVDAVRDGYRQRGNGAPAKPRTSLASEDPPGMLTSYSAILPDTGVMGGYMYSYGFADRDGWFLTPLFDADSGELLAIVDGTWMNPFKTGAAGAVAVDELARDDARSVAVIGSGPQARGQLLATATVRTLESVRVFSPTPDNRDAFAAEFDERLDASVRPVEDAASAVRGADVVITATTARDPVFDGDDLDDGAHVTAMGQYQPDRRELDSETIERSMYVPDLRERAMQDAGSLLIAMDDGAVGEDHVHAELGDVVAGNAPGRRSADDVTVFDSGGTGIETVAAAYMLYEKAIAADRGTTAEFSPASEALTGRYR